jgi:ABC-type amino acid transport substrate-binding protein
MFTGFSLVIQRLGLLLCLVAGAGWAETPAIRVAVLDNAPPMSFVDSAGQRTGFSAEIARALCEEMGVQCTFQVIMLNQVLDALVQNEVDIAAVSLLDTPERRRQILLAKPYFRSLSLWFAQPGVAPGTPDLRVAIVRGSAQERYALKQGWQVVGTPTNGELCDPLIAGVAQAAIIPMSTALNLLKNPAVKQLGLVSSVMPVPELSGEASFGINPKRPDLKKSVDEALDKIKRNGVYDRINSKFLPFRVN